MHACPRCREEVEALQQEVRRLRHQLAIGSTSLGLGLTMGEDQILRLLLDNERLNRIAYAEHRDADGWDGDLKILDVYVCRLRKKLAPLGVRIYTVWGEGYFLDESGKAKVRAHANAVRIDAA